MQALGSAFGNALGWAIAPFFALTSAARRARTFHPRGAVYHAGVGQHASTPAEYGELSARLAGPALVRFSGALWKHSRTLPDVLGCAIRLRGEAHDDSGADAGDQDILFATIRRPWTMPFAPFATDVRDYLANDYFAVSPFDTGTGQRVYLRLHPVARAVAGGGQREARLASGVANGAAALELGVSSRPFGPWVPIAVIALERPALVDGERLRFSPFRTGRGLRPLGFVHALRRGVYSLSQRARPEHAKPPR